MLNDTRFSQHIGLGQREMGSKRVQVVQIISFIIVFVKRFTFAAIGTSTYYAIIELINYVMNESYQLMLSNFNISLVRLIG